MKKISYTSSYRYFNNDSLKIPSFLKNLDKLLAISKNQEVNNFLNYYKQFPKKCIYFKIFYTFNGRISGISFKDDLANSYYSYSISSLRNSTNV